MAKTTTKDVADYIQPLYINGLHGRMLHMPAPAKKKREILFVYGHHSSLERWWGVMQDMNRYGAVTMPDLPGFGGMDSFYKIGKKPTIDAMADYLATFIMLRYKRKKVTIAGLSFGFVVVTRMLQRYPQLVDKVDMLVSVVGFAHRDDFSFSKPRYWVYRSATAFFAHRLPAFFFKNLALNPLAIRLGYTRTRHARSKFANKNKAELKQIVDFETHLWHCNDVRTHMYTNNAFLKVDNCRQQVDLPLWHISVKADQYFDQHLVEQHLRIIFKAFKRAVAKLDNHAPSIIADAEVAAPLLPATIRRALNKDPS